MVKNLNETLSLLVLTVLVAASLKVGLGLIFSSHLTGSVKGNYALFKDYINNEEE